MAKDGPGTSAKPARTRLDRNVRSPPDPVAPEPAGESRSDRHRAALEAAIHAAGEKSRLEFQRVFGQNLKAARLRLNLKQSDVADITGMTQQHLSLIEAGRQNVTIKTMALLAEVVDHDLLDLLKEVLGSLPEDQ